MKVAIIDLDSVAYAIGNGNKVLDETGQPLRENNKFVYVDKTEAELIQAAHFYMRSILSSGGFTHYIAYIKGNATTVKRVSINPNYKANRLKGPPTWWPIVKKTLLEDWGAIAAHDAEVDDYVNVARLLIPD